MYTAPEPLLWLCMFFAVVGKDKLGFAASTLVRFLGCSCFLQVLCYRGRDHLDVYYGRGSTSDPDRGPYSAEFYLLHVGVFPIILFLSAVGPGLTSKIPHDRSAPCENYHAQVLM